MSDQLIDYYAGFNARRIAHARRALEPHALSFDRSSSGRLS